MLTMLVQVLTNPHESKILLDTMCQFNQLCNYISRIAYDVYSHDKDLKCFRSFNLHNLDIGGISLYRHGEIFKCKSCGNLDHADLNAAKNLSQMGYLKAA